MVVDFIDHFAAIRVKVLISIPRCRPHMRPASHARARLRTAAKRTARSAPEPIDSSHRRRIHSVSFDASEDDWIDALVDLLTEAGYPKAGRSEIVRLGLLGLQDALAGRTRAENLHPRFKSGRRLQFH
jgi:hypothetical protein